MTRAARKQRRTFTLSAAAIQYLEQVQKEQKIESASSALENLIEESRRRRELAHLSSSIANYYSSLSEKQQREESAWSRFSDSEFAKISD